MISTHEPHDIGDDGCTVVKMRQTYSRWVRSSSSASMPRFSSMNPSSGVCIEKKSLPLSPRATRSIARPASTIIPATRPPKKR